MRALVAAALLLLTAQAGVTVQQDGSQVGANITKINCSSGVECSRTGVTQVTVRAASGVCPLGTYMSGVEGSTLDCSVPDAGQGTANYIASPWTCYHGNATPTGSTRTVCSLTPRISGRVQWDSWVPTVKGWDGGTVSWDIYDTTAYRTLATISAPTTQAAFSTVRGADDGGGHFLGGTTLQMRLTTPTGAAVLPLGMLTANITNQVGYQGDAGAGSIEMAEACDAGSLCTGIVAYYRFNGVGNVQDVTGHGHHMLSSVPLVTSFNAGLGLAADLNGTSVSLPSSLFAGGTNALNADAGTYSVFMWVKANDSDVSRPLLTLGYINGVCGLAWGRVAYYTLGPPTTLWDDQVYGLFFGGTANSWNVKAGTNALAASAGWTHVGIEGSVNQFIVNNNDGAQNGGGTVSFCGNGASILGGGETFVGGGGAFSAPLGVGSWTIDEMGIWNRNLNSNEWANLRDAGVHGYSYPTFAP